MGKLSGIHYITTGILIYEDNNAGAFYNFFSLGFLLII